MIPEAVTSRPSNIKLDYPILAPIPYPMHMSLDGGGGADIALTLIIPNKGSHGKNYFSPSKPGNGCVKVTISHSNTGTLIAGDYNIYYETYRHYTTETVNLVFEYDSSVPFPAGVDGATPRGTVVVIVVNAPDRYV